MATPAKVIGWQTIGMKFVRFGNSRLRWIVSKHKIEMPEIDPKHRIIRVPMYYGYTDVIGFCELYADAITKRQDETLN